LLQKSMSLSNPLVLSTTAAKKKTFWVGVLGIKGTADKPCDALVQMQWHG